MEEYLTPGALLSVRKEYLYDLIFIWHLIFKKAMA